MSVPAKYHVSYDFSDFETTQPNTPKPGVQLDVQFDDIETSISETVDALGDVRRSDGALVNGIVTEDSLEAGLLETLTATTGADAVEADAIAAAASAAAAAASAAILASVSATIAAGGYYLDDGSITDLATSTYDDGGLT